MKFLHRFNRRKPEQIDPFLTPSIVEVRSKMPDRSPLVSQLGTEDPGDVANSIMCHVALMCTRLEPGESIQIHLSVYDYDTGRRMTEAAWTQFFELSSDANYVNESNRSLVKGKLTVTYNFVKKMDTATP